MLIRVEPTTAIWGFQSNIDSDYSVWFSLNDSQPQDINVQELPADLQRAILGALSTKKLIQVDSQGHQIPFRMPEPAEKSSSEKEKLDDPAKRDPGLVQRAKDILAGGVASIRREVAFVVKEKNKLLLATILMLEKRGKRRKTIINLLERQVERLSPDNKDIVSPVVTAPARHSNNKLSALDRAFENAITYTEGEQETVTIQVKPLEEYSVTE